MDRNTTTQDAYGRVLWESSGRTARRMTHG